jgi:dihydrofolate synthase/folylpolyglutamate synthase
MFQQLPMFQNIGKDAFKKDLTNTLALLNAIGNPHLNQKWIHVAGTNGKGSVSSMLAATLTAHGYKTGLYTSPHLIDFRERIRINGICISESTVIEFINLIYDKIMDLQPSFFEITVALAFYHFHKEQIDIGVIEVGLGGRLDSTNVITPILSVITNIGWDHMDMLGNTLTAIASEKGGIIKSKIPVAIGSMEDEPWKVLKNIAIENSAKIYHDLPVDQGFERNLSLKGDYQKENIQTFTCAIEALKDLCFPLKRSVILEGLGNVTQLTGLRGRWEILQDNPFAVADTAHNEPGVKFTMTQFVNLLHRKQQELFDEYRSQIDVVPEMPRMHVIWGMVSDKDRGKILGLLPKDAQYYFCKPDVVRGYDANLLSKEGEAWGLIGESYNDVLSAYNAAVNCAKPIDMIYVGGSTFVVGDLLKSLGN